MSIVIRYLLVVLGLGLSGFSFSQTDFPKINFYYIVPSDRIVNQEYIDGIKKAALHMQSFYAEQTNGFVYSLNHDIVEIVMSDNDAQWHGEQMWGRAIETVGAQFWEENDVHIIYVDATLACTAGNGIGGTSGIAVMATNDLRGLAGETLVPDCSGNTDISDQNRWIGGLGHELGHALGLPHPPGCDDGDSNCDTGSIMWTGYATYPATYFGADAINALQNSNFLTQNYLNPRALPIKEDFENELSWINVGEYDWSITSGGTPSGNTGPSGAAQGSDYLYFETSSGHAYNAGDEAVIESDVFSAQDAKISFKYHMYGSDIGRLSVDVSRNGQWQTIWSISGQQHSSNTAAWSAKAIRLDSYSGNIKVRIRASASGNYRGDIAIDDIKIHEGLEVLDAYWDGTWAYAEWTPVSYANDYVQFIIGDNAAGRQWLYRYNSGADDRGDYLYQYYSKTDICNALGSGTFNLSVQIWPEMDDLLAGGKSNLGSVTCN